MKIVAVVLQSFNHRRRLAWRTEDGTTFAPRDRRRRGPAPRRVQGAGVRPLKFLPAGPAALLVELDDLDQVFSLSAEVERRRRLGWCPSLLDVVPGAKTLLLDGVDDPERTASELAGWSFAAMTQDPSGAIEVPCRYDGPDLAFVADLWGVAASEVAEVHSSLNHRVAFCGFMPGFAYIDGLGERLAVPRRPAPHAAVPAGSVALAGTYTGIYPGTSPGGWQLIGRTDVVLWDSGRQPPALLAPGAPVRFLPV